MKKVISLLLILVAIALVFISSIQSDVFLKIAVVLLALLVTWLAWAIVCLADFKQYKKTSRPLPTIEALEALIEKRKEQVQKTIELMDSMPANKHDGKPEDSGDGSERGVVQK